MNLDLPNWMIEALTGVDVPVDSSATTLVFDTPLPLWAWLLILSAALTIAWWSYRRLSGTSNTSTRSMRGVLVVLRTCSLLLVTVLLTGPSIRFARERVEHDRVVVLIDRSRSLSIADAPGAITRDAQATAILLAAESALGEISRGGATPDVNASALTKQELKPATLTFKDLSFMGFAESSYALTAAPGALLPDLGLAQGERTDLDSAIRQALANNAGRPLSGIVLLSDGRSLVPVSAETMRALERDAVPVFSVALGSRERVGDAAIISATIPPRVFVRDRVPVEVRVDRGALQGEIAVRLIDVASGSEIARRVLSETSTSSEETVMLDASADAAGSRSWRVELVTERRDLVRENDTRDLAVEFVDRPVRVLYIEGSSRWEYRYFKNLLLREKDVDSSIMLLSADRDFAQEGNMAISRLPRSKEEFSKYDLFVIGDVPSGFFSPEQLTILRSEVSERGAGLMWIGGERSTPSSWEGTALADLFPFRAPLTLEPRVGASVMKPTTAATRLGVLTLADDEDGWPDVFADSALSWPRLRYAQEVPRARVKPTAEVLAEFIAAGGATEEPSAAVLRMRFGAGEVVFVATDEIWRWRYGQGERYPERFWIPLVRLLARESLVQGDARAALEANPSQLSPGESAVLTLRLTDEETTQRVGALIPVDIVDSAGAVIARVELSRDGAEASALFPAERVGRFTAVANDPVFGRVTALIEVVRRDDELRHGDADHEALEELARRTGGQMLDATTLNELTQLLPDRARTTDESVTRPIWDSALALIAVLILLGAEWTGRRMLRLV